MASIKNKDSFGAGNQVTLGDFTFLFKEFPDYSRINDWINYDKNTNKVSMLKPDLSSYNKTILVKIIRKPGSTSKIILPADSSYMFSMCTNLQFIDQDHFDISKVTNMLQMFYGSALKSITLDNWNVSKVTIMAFMFGNCAFLDTIHISKWNVKNVLSMSRMFMACPRLQKLDISQWKINPQADLTAIFEGSCKLTDPSNAKNLKIPESLKSSVMVCITTPQPK
jgi:surface protein